MSDLMFESSFTISTYEPPPECYEPPPPECPDPEPKMKGNNGWGNGIDGSNPGTDKGNETQRASKNNEAGSIPDKFLFKFDGR